MPVVPSCSVQIVRMSACRKCDNSYNTINNPGSLYAEGLVPFLTIFIFGGFQTVQISLKIVAIAISCCHCFLCRPDTLTSVYYL